MEINIAQFEPDSFKYEPLPTASSIRLLTLFAFKTGKFDHKGFIKGLLRTVDLNDDPIYKTLSYTWGNPFGKYADPKLDPYNASSQRTLIVNGRLFLVGRNLHSGLRHLLTLPARDRSIDKRLLPYNDTELIRSSRLGHIKRVSYCLERGADLHSRNQYGETALHCAAGRGHRDVVELLIAYGADTTLLDKSNWSPLGRCLRERKRDYDDVARILRQPDTVRRLPRHEHMSQQGQDVLVWDFWVDSICIDQQNSAERNAQVAMMGRIYSSSISTLVWLGAASKATVEKISVVAKTDDPWVWTTTPDSDDLTARKRTAMGLIASRTWFSRRWVVQEYCLAQDTEMYCGKVEIDIKLLPQWGPPQVNGLRSLRNWYLSHTDTTMYHPEKKQALPGLLPLAVITFGYESTDLRDSIFSLLGLAQKASNTVQSLEKSFTVDYDRPVIPVVTEIAKELMEARLVLKPQLWDHGMVIEPLHALCLTQIQPATRIEGMPSWVPNFHKGLPSKRLTRPEFCASGKRTKCKIWRSEMAALNVDAYMLDTITQTEPKATIDEPGSTMTVNLASWIDLASDRGPNGMSGSGTIQIETLWRTLMADDDAFQQSEERATEPVPRQSFKDFLCGHLKQARDKSEEYQKIWNQLEATRNTNNEDLIPTSKEVEDFELPESWDNKDWYQAKKSRFEQCLYVYYVQRILFRTVLGYLGLGLNTIQPGDQVWLLAGTRTPFVLRPTQTASGEEQFHFVAECYVHGVMYGEAVDGRDDVVFSPIVIV